MSHHLIRGSALIAALTSNAWAQDTALTRILIANRHPIRIVDGQLADRGGRLLVDEGKEARFFLIGEEHGVKEAPAVVQALLSELRPVGFNTFAIEVSPLQGERLDALTSRSRMRARLDTLLSSWLTTVPFYLIAEERDLLASAMSRQGALASWRTVASPRSSRKAIRRVYLHGLPRIRFSLRCEPR